MRCEIAVKEILPAVRSLLALELKALDLRQGEIAEKLGLTQPAVSRYLRQARGRKAKQFSKNKRVMNVIVKSARELKQGKAFDFCSLCKAIRKITKCCE